MPGDLLPLVQFSDASGQPVWNTANGRGMITVINFWATWCEPCKEEIPVLEKKLAVFRTDPRFNFLLVSIDKDRKAASEWLEKVAVSPDRIKNHLVFDPDFKATTTLGIATWPSTLILGPDARVLFLQRGYLANQGLVDKMFDRVSLYLKAVHAAVPKKTNQLPR